MKSQAYLLTETQPRARRGNDQAACAASTPPCNSKLQQSTESLTALDLRWRYNVRHGLRFLSSTFLRRGASHYEMVLLTLMWSLLVKVERLLSRRCCRSARLLPRLKASRRLMLLAGRSSSNQQRLNHARILCPQPRSPHPMGC